jgi:hypothetical protein
VKRHKLYWCEGPLGFSAEAIVADSIQLAKKMFATKHGHYMIDCSAKRFAFLPNQYTDQQVSEVSDQILQDCGVMIVDNLSGYPYQPDTLKIISMANRHFKKHKGRVLFHHKTRFLIQENKGPV